VHSLTITNSRRSSEEYDRTLIVPDTRRKLPKKPLGARGAEEAEEVLQVNE